MSTIVEASIPVDQFALADTFETVPEAEFEILRMIACDDSDACFVWATADDPGRITVALEDDEATADVRTVAELEEACLYRLEWTSPICIVFSLLAGADGTVLRAHGNSTGWELSFLFPEHCAASETHEVCKDYGIEMTVRRVSHPSETSPDGRGTLAEKHLTDKQREALLLAYEAGYYDVPRRTSLKELAAQQGISHQSLSERLRRGHRALIESQRGNFVPLSPTSPATMNGRSRFARTFQSATQD
jgi:predicted DNA binding protein